MEQKPKTQIEQLAAALVNAESWLQYASTQAKLKGNHSAADELQKQCFNINQLLSTKYEYITALPAKEASARTATYKELFSRTFAAEQYRLMHNGVRCLVLSNGPMGSKVASLRYWAKRDPSILDDLRDLGYEVEATSKTDPVYGTIEGWVIRW